MCSCCQSRVGTQRCCLGIGIPLQSSWILALDIIKKLSHDSLARVLKMIVQLEKKQIQIITCFYQDWILYYTSALSWKSEEYAIKHQTRRKVTLEHISVHLIWTWIIPSVRDAWGNKDHKSMWINNGLSSVYLILNFHLATKEAWTFHWTIGYHRELKLRYAYLVYSLAGHLNSQSPLPLEGLFSYSSSPPLWLLR